MLINKTHIFLSALTGERMEQKLELTLKRAGFHFEKQSKTAIETTHCSVHYISPSLNEESKALQAEEHFKMVMQHSKEKEHYKSFFWMPQNGKTQESGNEGNSFINRLQNNLSNNMILSTAPYPIQFVEDIRLILEEQPKKTMDTTPTDIFLICNQIDEAEAQQIHSMLSDIVAMVKLVIVQDQDTDYEEYASQQMNVSKLSVIYYHNGADWAMPFAQQIWKKVGGASSKSPILLLGDSNNPNNTGKTFQAPRVIPMNLPAALVPLEIKVQLDKINES